ncbi:MAG: hypothetical protein A2089_12610 [Elusimicrobia bacterium GWD2_63_28]|nr:MAG: hypothetical protein A2089_12610 [Elusimicrobia bacterium GWD2_63_28]
MKIFFANLNPCNTRKVNVRQCRAFARECGHSEAASFEEADLVLVWACEFRADWRDFSFAVVKEIKERCSAKVVYIGCTFGDGSRSRISAELGVPVIPWNDGARTLDKFLSKNGLSLAEIPLEPAEEKLVDSASAYRKQHPLANVCFEDEYVKLSICEGCNGNCSYCSEKQMFPAFRSFPERELISECRKAMQKSKTRRVMFLGDSTGDYGADTGSSLPRLIERLISEAAGDIEIGISQLNPEHFLKYSESMFSFIKSKNIRYINIPIQSASDRVLRSMRRKYNAAGIEKIFSGFRGHGFTNFSTHLLLGYPGETSDDVDVSVEFVLRHAPKHVVVSAFMPHPTIAASGYEGQVSSEETSKRISECEKRLAEAGIAVATDWGSITQRLMNRIRNSLGLRLSEYSKGKGKNL